MVSIDLETVYERLFQDDEGKDVKIELSDGTLWAHATMLGAASEAIQGMLKHGTAQQQKSLSWKEHACEVGRFFLRLLYTGTVAEDEWEGSYEGTQIPLHLLLGALAISKVFQVPHLLKPLTDVAKKRIVSKSFDQICTSAIDLDLTELRRCCLQYAEQHGKLELPRGTRLRAERDIHESDNADHADVPAGILGIVTFDESDDDDLEIHWDNGQLNSLECGLEMIRVGMVKVVSRTTELLFDRYQRGELSPQVIFELAPLWGPQRPYEAKRRKLI